MSEEVSHKGFADIAFKYKHARFAFENALEEAGLEFENTDWDDYDCSVEIYGALPDARLNETMQKIIYEAGFLTAYVNHTDKWETHYDFKLNEPFKQSAGWRVRYGHKQKPPVNYIEVEKFPDKWPDKWRTDDSVRIIAPPQG